LERDVIHGKKYDALDETYEGRNESPTEEKVKNTLRCPSQVELVNSNSAEEKRKDRSHYAVASTR
jgi:hypothetical protein